MQIQKKKALLATLLIALAAAACGMR